MSTIRIRSNRQLTIPEEVLEKLDLGIGDALEADVEEGKLILSPKTAAAPAPVDRKLVQAARRKITRIRKNPARSRGLTPSEVDVAARAGLIDSDQRWWWTEPWQTGERQAEREIKAGRVKVFESVDQLLKDLGKR